MEEKRLPLEVESLMVRFGGRVVLTGASFKLREGEVVGLIGGNGSGKTTLLNALSGFVSAEGSILLDGIEISGFTPWRRVRAGVIRTVQKGQWSDRLSQREAQEVRFWCRQLSASENAFDRLRSTVESALPWKQPSGYTEQSALPEKARRDVEEVFSAHPRIALLDEPLAGESPTMLRRLKNLLEVLRSSKGCAIIVEHRVGLLEQIVDTIWEMHAGAVTTHL